MRFVQIPVDALSRQALDGLIEEFVIRDGTDYGTEERSLDDKKDAVRRQLDCGEIVIVFDPETETSNIISKDDLRSSSSRLGARHLGVSRSTDGLGLSNDGKVVARPLTGRHLLRAVHNRLAPGAVLMPDVEEPASEPTRFAALGLRPEILEVLSSLGYEEPTPIQRETIPRLLTGRDLLGQAAHRNGQDRGIRPAGSERYRIRPRRHHHRARARPDPRTRYASQRSRVQVRQRARREDASRLRGTAHPAPAPGPPAWCACGGCYPRSGDRPHTTRVTSSRRHPHRDSRRGRRDARHGLR